jgi:hypothetical protein
MVENAGGDVKPARRFASDEGGKPRERDMHRRLREIAAMELSLRPGEVFQRVRRDIAGVRHGQQRQKAIVLAVPIPREQRRPAEPRSVLRPGDERVEGCLACSTAHDFSSSAIVRRKRPIDVAPQPQSSGTSSLTDLRLSIRDVPAASRLLQASPEIYSSAHLASRQEHIANDMLITVINHILIVRTKL